MSKHEMAANSHDTVNAHIKHGICTNTHTYQKKRAHLDHLGAVELLEQADEIGVLSLPKVDLGKRGDGAVGKQQCSRVSL
jgi:hypothetical protein